MARYVEGSDRQQVTLLPECLDDYIAEDTHFLSNRLQVFDQP